MKQLLLVLGLVSIHCISFSQATTTPFTEADFKAQFEKIVCSGKSDFAEFVDKPVVFSGDTTWKSKVKLPGFNFANFSKSKSMIDHAFVAYQKFTTKEEALSYYQQVKTAINNATGECLKLQPAHVPVQIQGVEQYDLWKSTEAIPYNDLKNILVYASLSLDKENDVTVNVFLKKGL